MTYLLDTNVFIQAKNLGFAFDVCPGFWDWIVLARADGRVLSVDRVGQELRGREDDLRDWADAQGPALFAPPDASVFEALAKVSTGSPHRTTGPPRSTNSSRPRTTS